MMTLTIAIRNIFRHRTRTLITLFTIAFGCVAIIFVHGFFEDALREMRDSYIKAITGHLQVCKRGAFDKGFARPLDYIIDAPKDIISLIEKTPGVRVTSSRLVFSGLMSTGENSVSFLGQGVEPQKEQSVICRSSEDFIKLMRDRSFDKPDVGGVTIESGDSLEAKDTYSAILGKGLAKNLDIKPGDSIVLLTNTVGGSINAVDAKAKGIFYTGAKAFDDIALRVPLSTAQTLLRTEGVNNIVVRLFKTEDTQRVKELLEKAFKVHSWDLEIRTWDEMSDFYTKTKMLFYQQLFILEFVMTVVVLLSIFSTMNMAVLERTSEIGTIMALGTKRRGVIKLFMYEGLVLGIIGGLLGMGAGWVVIKMVSTIGIPMPPAPGMTFNWISQPDAPAKTYVLVFFLSVVAGLVSSIFPAYKASRLEIATALRGNA
ncbi:MAG: ABC transporter permease [Candidatus Omnitrophica bacterium]|nr:ABC transporter permease [Candidatus Omnitrophota bacterium]